MGAVKMSKPIGAATVKSYWREHFAATGSLIHREGGNYYREGAKELAGQWHGDLAAHWNLLGGAAEELHISRLADGQDPHTAAQLVRKRGEADIAARDITFGMPKSYSCVALVAGDQRLIAIGDAAVRKALDAGQKYARARLGGNNAPENSANWACAIFMHDTARPTPGHAPNPHLHWHSVVFNAVLADDGRVRAMEPAEIYKVQRYMNAIFQAEIAYGARELGYRLDSHERGRATELAGYSKEFLEAMSRRSKEINDEMEVRGTNGAEAHERINKALRQSKQEWDAAELRAAWLAEAKSLGQDVNVLQGAAQKVLSDKERSKLADRAIEYALDSLYEFQSVTDHYEVMQRALLYELGSLRTQDIDAAWARRQLGNQKKHGAIVEVEHYRTGKPGARYTTGAMLAIERQTIHIALRGRGISKPISQISWQAFEDRFQHSNIGRKKIKLNQDQLLAAFSAVTSLDQWLIVRGVAGAGKSTAFNVVAKVAQESTAAGYEVRGLAATSSATNNLRELAIPAETLQAHNLHSIEPDAQPRVYILDEGSLAGGPTMRRFAGSVRPCDRVIIAYDPRQHQSVEAGRMVEQMEAVGVDTISLEQIVRQSANPKLLRVIELIRDGFESGAEEKITQALRLLDGEMGCVAAHENKHARVALLADYYLVDPVHTLLVAPDNLTIRQLNEAVRTRLKASGAIGKDQCDFTVLTGIREMGTSDKYRAASYEAGDVIRWYKKSTLGGAGRVEPGEYTEVVAVNTDKNKLTIRTKKGDIIFNPRAAIGEVYSSSKRVFAVGDRVQTTRPWTQPSGPAIPGRALGQIVALNADGVGVIDFDGRRVAWDIKTNPHMEYGYASTSYSAQSLTFNRVGVHVDCGDSRLRALTDKVLGYVGFSRAARELYCVTDDKTALLGQESPLLRHNVKPTAIPLAVGAGRRRMSA